ncbi:peptidase inhibitor family I36 protein [Streptomyces katrae]|uniref:Peptidase inhibitor family I36 protein n=1 Tax=Streptomyces katrae TaxID=68223 RepID=A0ABT7GYB3_9ACTN|nr:peptidase inhibitor family I36 protein [Streptomyces katrae]MDK9498617.1 peptidase inhibitor family I36 protein [Streptomyces katrae]
MFVKKFARRAGAAAAGAALIVTAAAASASASDVRIDQWRADSRCDNDSPYFFCLWYSPNRQGGFWGSSKVAVPTLSGNFSDGHAIRNNAASADNGAGTCDVRIWVYPNYVGDSNVLSGFYGGNLTPNLRNNEASMAVDGPGWVSSCPAVRAR